MSAAKRGRRFSYLRTDPEGTQTNPDEDAGKAREPEGSFAAESIPTNDNRSAGGEGRSYATSTQELASVPKGKGRMKQERSQLNVRIPTMLKRQASAKAVLEGRDIGEVVAALLREYLDR